MNFVGYIGNQISIRQLQQAVSVSPEQKSLSLRDVVYEESISKACSSLIRKTKNGRNFEFAHFSVREFLESTRLPGLGLGQYQISRYCCDRLFDVQCLRFLHLENFNISITPQGGSVKEAESGILGILASRADEYPFYIYAAESWLKHARSQWSDEEVWELSQRLFDPRKSNHFTQWALHMLRVQDTSNETKASRTLTGILSPRFTTLHFAAILGIPEIYQFLVAAGDSISAQRRELRQINEDRQHIQHDVTRTVDCVLGAQASLLPRQSMTRKPALMGVALVACSAVMDLSRVPMLTQNGVDPREEDQDDFQKALIQLCSSIKESYHAFEDLRGHNSFKATEE